MEWKESFNIGIDVIDHQHRQILQYINTLEEIIEADRQARTAAEQMIRRIGQERRNLH